MIGSVNLTRPPSIAFSPITLLGVVRDPPPVARKSAHYVFGNRRFLRQHGPAKSFLLRSTDTSSRCFTKGVREFSASLFVFDSICKVTDYFCKSDSFQPYLLNNNEG